MEYWEAFREFLTNRQPPRSPSGSTADDAIEFLRSLPSDEIVKVVEGINAASFKEMDEDHKENPFSSSLVRTFLDEHAIGNEESSKNKLNIPGGQHEDEKMDNLCEKCLTTSDDLHRLVVTAKEDACKYFPLATVLRSTDNFLQLEDDEGKSWLFEFSYLKLSRIYEFTEAWSSYVKEKQLGVGLCFHQTTPYRQQQALHWLQKVEQ